MNWFRGRKKQECSRAALERKLADISDKGKSDPPLADHEITGVMGLALQRLTDATAKTRRTTTAAVDHMRVTGLQVAQSVPPAPDD